MPGYLQRLLDTAAPSGPGPVSLSPVVRSTSPVFEQDQLLGLQGQEPAPVDVPSAPVWHEPLSASKPPLQPPSDPSLGTLIAVPPVPVPAPAPLPDAPATPPEVALDADFEPAPPRAEPSGARLLESSSPIDLPPLRRTSPPVRAVPPPVVAELAETPPAQAEERRDRLQVPTAEALDVRQDNDTSPHLTDAPVPADPADPVPRAEPTEPPAPKEQPPRIELSPRPRPEPMPDAPYYEPEPVSAPPAQPTITIGHVTVEVVGEPASAAPAPRQLTAASASVIGPLGQSRTTRRLIALRRL